MTRDVLTRWADARETSLPVAEAIFEIAASETEAQRIWDSPSDDEMEAIKRRLWQRPADENEWHWGRELTIVRAECAPEARWRPLTEVDDINRRMWTPLRMDLGQDPDGAADGDPLPLSQIDGPISLYWTEKLNKNWHAIAGTEIQLAWLPEAGRAGICNNDRTHWTDATSPEDALRRYLTDEMAP